MTNTQIDLLEIKQIMKKMQKDIEKLKALVRDDYFDDKIIDFYNENNSRFERRKKIDELMNYYIDMKERYSDNAKIVDMCDRVLTDLHDEYIDLTLEDEE